MSGNFKPRQNFKRKSDSNNTQNHAHSSTSYYKRFSTFLKKKQKSIYDPNEEMRLEEIVFGDPTDIIVNLPNNEITTKVEDNEPVDTYNEKETSDKRDKLRYNLALSNSENANSKKKKAAWKDDDDYNYTTYMDMPLSAQICRLQYEMPEELYATYLKNKYKLFVGTPKWAELKKSDKADIDTDLDNDVLKHSCHLNIMKQKNLPKNIIDIKVLSALNKSTHIEGPIITSIDFHPSATVALVAGTSSILSLFQVDGHTNSKLHSMQFKKFPISKATFAKEGTQVLLGSQYHSHYYTYDLMNGKTYKSSLPHRITNMKYYELSPDGKLIALCGRMGEIYLVNSNTKELISTFSMNAKCRTLAFTPDGKTLITHGDCSEMYIWDLNTRTCIHRAIDDGCLSCISSAVSPSGQFIATGSAEGVVNLYDTKAVLEEQSPQPLKIMLNLVTGITSLKFNPTSEILSMASDKKYNAFKMMHLPSFTVFSNFPTFQTKIGMPQTIGFSPGSGYLAISNKTGSALLYRLRHYGNY